MGGTKLPHGGSLAEASLTGPPPGLVQDKGEREEGQLRVSGLLPLARRCLVGGGGQASGKRDRRKRGEVAPDCTQIRPIALTPPPGETAGPPGSPQGGRGPKPRSCRRPTSGAPSAGSGLGGGRGGADSGGGGSLALHKVSLALAANPPPPALCSGPGCPRDPFLRGRGPVVPAVQM